MITYSNNSFYIVCIPCLRVERALFFYLAYIWLFVDFLAWGMKLVDAIAPTNLHLFWRYFESTGCLKIARCRATLSKFTLDYPILLSFLTYCYVAVSVSKKHFPALL
jgi:hypothetical protein